MAQQLAPGIISGCQPGMEAGPVKLRNIIPANTVASAYAALKAVSKIEFEFHTGRYRRDKVKMR